MEPKYCATCGAEVTTKYCGQCGAKYAVKDVSLKSFVGVIIETITNWEQKMVNTLKYLFIEPGKVPKAFILGDRITYFHPIKFVLFWGGLNLLITNYFKVGIGEIDPEQDVYAQKVMSIWSNYGALCFMAIIPLLSVAPYLFFRKLDPSFVHYTVVLSYITGINFLISIPTITIEGLWRDFRVVRDIIGPLFPLLYVLYMYYNYFDKKVWKSILAGLLTIVFLFLGFTIIFLVLYYFFVLIDS
jgi:hypothetical protein